MNSYTPFTLKIPKEHYSPSRGTLKSLLHTQIQQIAQDCFWLSRLSCQDSSETAISCGWGTKQDNLQHQFIAFQLVPSSGQQSQDLPAEPLYFSSGHPKTREQVQPESLIQRHGVIPMKKMGSDLRSVSSYLCHTLWSWKSHLVSPLENLCIQNHKVLWHCSDGTQRNTAGSTQLTCCRLGYQSCSLCDVGLQKPCPQTKQTSESLLTQVKNPTKAEQLKQNQDNTRLKV